MQRPVVVVDPGHGGQATFFYDMENGVQLAYTWEEVAGLDPGDKRYFSHTDQERWERGEIPREPRFYFERKGRKITYGDPGSLSPLDPRICEKDLVLDVARWLHTMMQADLLVKSTRDRDGYVAAGSRLRCIQRVAERWHGSAVLVSLHTEASSDPALRGFRIRRPPGRALRLATMLREALTEHLEDLGLRNFVQEIREEKLPILQRSEVPGVVVELGFLSNLEDAQRLLDRHLRQELASVLAMALRRYLGEEAGPAESREGNLVALQPPSRLAEAGA